MSSGYKTPNCMPPYERNSHAQRCRSRRRWLETIECLTMVDVMRRGGVRATLVSIMPTREVVSSLQIPVTCDVLFDEIDFDEYDCVVLPGGLPGATNLRADQRVCNVVCDFAATKHVAAICAAPFILGELGLLEGRRATCFPGFEKSFPEGTYTGEKVTQDGNIITASGMAQSLPLPWSCCARSPAKRPSRRSPRASNYDFGFAIAAPHRADARGGL